MIKYKHLIAAGLILLIACEVPRKGLDQIFPGAGFEKGWSWHGSPKHYFPENLYDYINGEAELYLSYGFCYAIVRFLLHQQDQLHLPVLHQPHQFLKAVVQSQAP